MLDRLPLHSLLALAVMLAACKPKAAPEDQAFKEAQVVVAAFAAGEAEPQPLNAELTVVATAQSYIGEYVWEMYAATSAAKAVIEPLVVDDPRYAGVVVATPAPQTDGCCFTVHFLANVEGELRPWVTARAGWDLTAEVSHNAADGLPEPGPADQDLAERGAKWQAAKDLPTDRMVVVMKDLTRDPNDDDVWVYGLPKTPEDTVSVGLIANFWDNPAEDPLFIKVTTSAKTWPRSAVDDGVGLFLESTGRAPSEAHIFASRFYGFPLWVRLDTGLWRVEGNGVGLYGTRSP